MTAPKTLGKYQIETFLGKGAFAEVYKAVDMALKRTVALKILKPALIVDEEAFERFTQEAQMAANLFHPHIATVLDIGEAEGHYFIAMRYVDGKSLDKVIIERGALPWEEALKITDQIAGALQFAHEKGLVHRDVKPQNILINEDGDAVLTDFGLAKALYSSGISSTTSMIGTPVYIPPEIWEGKPASLATDQYALACVLVEMITGRVLFDGNTPPAVMAKHFRPIFLPKPWPEKIPEGLEIAIRKALAKNPDERFVDLVAFMKAVRSPNKIEFSRQPSASNKFGIYKWLGIATILILLLVVCSILSLSISSFWKQKGDISVKIPGSSPGITDTPYSSVYDYSTIATESIPTVVVANTISPTLPSTPSIPLPFYDNFDSGASSSWEVVSGNWITVDGEYTVIPVSGGPVWRWSSINVSPLRDYRITSKVLLRGWSDYTGAATTSIAIAVRVAPQQERFLTFYIQYVYGEYWRATWALVSGSDDETLLSEFGTDVPSPMTLRIDVAGDLFIASINNQEYKRLSLSGYPNGNVMLGIQCQIIPCPSFNEVQIEEIIP